MPDHEDLRYTPWCWATFGRRVWTLVTKSGGGRVILQTLPARRRTDPPRLVVRSVEDGSLIDLTPDHPIAKALEELPALIEICTAVAGKDIPEGGDLTVEAARALLVKIGPWRKEAKDAAA